MKSRCSRHPHGGQTRAADGNPGAPQVQDGGRDADSDAVKARRILPALASHTPTGLVKGSRAAGEKTKRIAGTRHPRLHRRSGVTMKQTVPHRKQIIALRHELAVINIQATNLHLRC